MYLIINLAVRGGLSGVGSCRHVTANNPHCENYDSTKPLSYIGYFDVNNLYGFSMVQALPLREFEFIENIDINTILSTPDDAPYGFILSVTLHYPSEIHDLHNDFPMCGEHLKRSF